MVRLASRSSLNQAVDFQAHLRIEAGGRLIQEQQLRIVDQRQRQRHPLLLAARKFRVELVALFAELQAVRAISRDPRCVE